MENKNPEWVDEISQGEKIISDRNSDSSSENSSTSSSSQTNFYESGANVKNEANVSSKSRLAMTLLSFFLGSLGIHDFYAGKIAKGVWRILLSIFSIIFYFAGLITFVLNAEASETFSIIGLVVFIIGVAGVLACGIWQLVSFIYCVCGLYKDKNGCVIKKWE